MRDHCGADGHERVLAMFAELKQQHPRKFDEMTRLLQDCHSGAVSQAHFPSLSLQLLQDAPRMRSKFAQYYTRCR